MGQNLESCSTEELQSIDTQLERSLRNIRAKKVRTPLINNYYLENKMDSINVFLRVHDKNLNIVRKNKRPTLVRKNKRPTCI